METNRFDEETETPRTRPPGSMPVGAAAVAGLFVGLAFGAAAVAVAWTVESQEVRQELAVAEPESALSVADHEAEVEEANANIAAMQDRIQTLEGEVKEREDKVIALEAEMARRYDRGVALKKQLDQARAELEDSRAQLQVALAEKDQLTKQLAVTVAALDKQRLATDAAIHTGHEGRWDNFVATAKLEVCEKGGRNKTKNCREAVNASLNEDLHAKFLHCLKAGQEAPKVAEADKQLVELPEHAQWLDQQEKATRDWYVQLCDPTLPEAKSYADLGPITLDETTQGS